MRLLSSLAVILLLAVTPVISESQGHGAPPHTQTATAPHSHTTSHTQATHTTTSAHKSGTHGATTHGTTSKHSSTTTATGTTTGTTTTSPVAAKIQSHPKLASKLTAMLPKGATLDQAATGFKNQGQFIAALHVSQNLGIPFADLKAQMTGIPANSTTGTATTGTKSLGQAIQTLKPSADAKTETERAETEADHDVKTTTTTSTTSSSTTNAPKTKKH
jgi:hypothetical protein